MSRDFSAATILAHRYDVYVEQAPAGRRSDKDEFWFFTPSACKQILSAASLSSERTDLLLRLQRAGVPALAEFFANWMMYRDGIEHAGRRRTAVAVLKQIIDCSHPGTVITMPNDGRELDLVAHFAEPFAWRFMCNAFGVPQDVEHCWHELLGLVCSVPGMVNPSTEALLPIEAALIRLRSEVTAQSDFRLKFLVEEAASDWPDETALVDLVINLLGDGVHPTSAALASEVHARFARDPSAARRGDSFYFHREAPFQYVARTSREALEIDGIEIHQGTRVVACIGAAACETIWSTNNRPLTFGFGRHSCPGRRLAEACVKDGLVSFSRWASGRTLQFDQPEWVASIGYRAMARCSFLGVPLP
ncbi:MAG TPA: hypothetical protein VF548_15890 [Allosphingosinicella sp.]